MSAAQISAPLAEITNTQVYQSLGISWQSDADIDWIAIGANIFDVRPTVNSTFLMDDALYIEL